MGQVRGNRRAKACFNKDTGLSNLRNFAICPRFGLGFVIFWSPRLLPPGLCLAQLVAIYLLTETSHYPPGSIGNW